MLQREEIESKTNMLCLLGWTCGLEPLPDDLGKQKHKFQTVQARLSIGLVWGPREQKSAGDMTGSFTESPEQDWWTEPQTCPLSAQS